MLKKALFPVLLAALVLAVAPLTARAQDDKITVGFLPGVVDPFYQVM